MQIARDIFYVGVDDHDIDLFEGMYEVPNGMAYNSYLIVDEKVAVMDSVEKRFGDEWLGKIETQLGGRTPDYLVVQHMEPDHSANIARFMERYPSAQVVASAGAFRIMAVFFHTAFEDRRMVVGEGDTLSLGARELRFIAAPMVHWPEVIFTYCPQEKVLFTADAFGKFGALDADEPWEDEARRYYFNIVGKFGANVQSVLKKAEGLDIAMICPLHGPVLTDTIPEVIALYDLWSSYAPETDGVLVAYASLHGNTAAAANLLADKLEQAGMEVQRLDLARCDASLALSEAFRYSKVVLASASYNGGAVPCMEAALAIAITDALLEKDKVK